MLTGRLNVSFLVLSTLLDGFNIGVNGKIVFQVYQFQLLINKYCLNEVLLPLVLFTDL